MNIMSRRALRDFRDGPLEQLAVWIIGPPTLLIAGIVYAIGLPFRKRQHSSWRTNSAWKEYNQQQDERERHGDPTPLPRARPWSLTLTQASGEIQSIALKRTMHTSSDQGQSPLFTKLSAELRVEVYRWVLSSGGALLHLARAHQKLTHIRCFDDGPDSSKRPWRHECWGFSYRDGSFHMHPHNNIPPDRDLLALLKTCREMYEGTNDSVCDRS